VTVLAEFTQATIEQRRQTLQQLIADREMQLWHRERDLEVWRAMAVADLNLDPAEADERVLNNRSDECKQNIAAAIKDTTHLGIQLTFLRRDLAALDKGKMKAVAAAASKQ